MNFLCVVPLWFLLCSFPAFKACPLLQVGDECIQRNGNEGVCGQYSSCKMDFDDHKPKVCSYGEDDVVVCCNKRKPLKWKGMSQKYCKYQKKLSSHLSSIGFLNLREPQKSEIYRCNKYQSLIVGGDFAKPREFPHFGAIGFKINGEKRFLCGSSLISERFVLTAGHCASDAEGNEPSFVRFGDLDLETLEDDENSADYDIEKFILHPDYQPLQAKYNDIALIKLENNVIFTSYIRPACLSSPENDVKEGSLSIAIGTGAMRHAEAEANILQKVSLHVFYSSLCSTYYRKDKKMTRGVLSSQICAGSDSYVKDTCSGDSGGPLMTIEKENSCLYNIVGITSFGKFCGAKAAIYTRVSSYIDWIEKTVWS